MVTVLHLLFEELKLNLALRSELAIAAVIAIEVQMTGPAMWAEVPGPESESST